MNKRLIKPSRLLAMAVILVLLLTVYLVFLYDLQIIQGEEYYNRSNELSTGLVIGTLTAVQTEAGGQVEYGIVEPQCDLDSLVQVFIIKDFEVVE